MTRHAQGKPRRRKGAAGARETRPAAEPTETGRVLAERRGYLIRRVHQIADLYFAEETARFGVTPVQYGALRVVKANPGIDQLRLGNALRCDRTTVSGVVRRLEAKRLIRRTTDRADRRAKALYLTPAGARLMAPLSEAAARAEARILTGLPAAERKRVFAALDRAVRVFEAPAKKG